MRKQLILATVSLAVIAAGIAAFSAFTAQVINLTAHVEKEIEFQPVVNCRLDETTGAITCEVDPSGGDYGTVIPEEEYDKVFEVTLSKSFRDNEGQPEFGDVHFDLLWECKQERDGHGPFDDWNNLDIGSNGKYDNDTPDRFPDCLARIPHANPNHPNGELDGLLRDFVTEVVGNRAACEIEDADHEDASVRPEEKEVEFIWHGVLVDDLGDFSAKCFYTVKLLAPPCRDSYNPFTDPKAQGAAQTVECHLDTNGSDDPQDWERFADIGDDLKVQVTFHSLRPQE